jgi:hypothetical protein
VCCEYPNCTPRTSAVVLQCSHIPVALSPCYKFCFSALHTSQTPASVSSVSPLSSQPSFSPLSSQPSQFHSCKETVINDDLSDYHKSEAPLASLLSLPPPPLGTIGNPIVVSDDKDDINSLFSRPSYHEARSTFTTPTLQLLHC